MHARARGRAAAVPVGKDLLSHPSHAGHLEVTFAPGHAAMGGMLLGLAAATQMLLTGRLLGISGTVRSTVMGLSLLEPWRQALLAGLALTALPLALLLPSSFASLPESYTVSSPLTCPMHGSTLMVFNWMGPPDCRK